MANPLEHMVPWLMGDAGSPSTLITFPSLTWAITPQPPWQLRQAVRILFTSSIVISFLGASKEARIIGELPRPEGRGNLAFSGHFT